MSSRKYCAAKPGGSKSASLETGSKTRPLGLCSRPPPSPRVRKPPYYQHSRPGRGWQTPDMPEWPGSYSTLGVFYYQTGEIAKAREVLNDFKGSNAAGGLDVNRIEEALAKAPTVPSSLHEPM